MRRAVLLALLLVAWGAVGGRAAPVPQAQTLTPGQVLAGRFTQERHLAGLDVPLSSGGHFLLVAGKGLVLWTERPFATVTAIGPGGITQITGGEPTRISAAKFPFLARFYEMLGGALAGDWRPLERDFAIAAEGDAAAWRVVLTPQRKDDTLAAQFTSITVAGGRFVEALEVRRGNGDWDRSTFVDQAVSTAPPDAEASRLIETAGK